MSFFGLDAVLLWQASSSIRGTSVCTLTIRSSSHNSGLAINGSAMVVANDKLDTVTVYSLPDGALQAEFGGPGSAPGSFKRLQRVCFSPRSGNILIADGFNNRIQVRETNCYVTVRFIW